MRTILERLRKGGRNGDEVTERAQRERWPAPDDLHRLVVGRLAAIIDDPESKPRDVTAAVRALVVFLKLDLDEGRGARGEGRGLEMTFQGRS